jgi:hypothetical protein
VGRQLPLSSRQAHHIKLILGDWCKNRVSRFKKCFCAARGISQVGAGRARLCARRHEMVACGALKGHRVRGPRARHHASAQVPPGPTGSLVYCNESLARQAPANTPRFMHIYKSRRRRVHFKYISKSRRCIFMRVRKIHGRCRHEPR